MLQQLLKHTLHDPQALFHVGHLATTKNDRDLDLVLVLEAHRLFELELDIMVAGLGADLISLSFVWWLDDWLCFFLLFSYLNLP